MNNIIARETKSRKSAADFLVLFEFLIHAFNVEL